MWMSLFIVVAALALGFAVGAVIWDHVEGHARS